MNLTKIAIERPLTVIMVILAIVLLGVQAYGMLNVDRLPKINAPVVAIVTVYPGAAPKDIEDQIVKKTEDEVAGISGVDKVTSVAQDSMAVTMVQFLETVNGDQAVSDVERAIARIKSEFPTEAKEPNIIKADVQALPIMNITLSGPQPLDEMYRIADEEIKPLLLAVQGVGAISVVGGLEREVQVQANPSKMAGYGLSFSAIGAALQTENVNVPVGSVTTQPDRLAIRSVGRFASVEDIQNLLVAAGSQQVRVKDFATVVQTHKEVAEILRLNGQETVGLAITKQSDANAVATADKVRAALDAMQPLLPQGAKLNVVTDDSEYTRASVNSVQTDLLLAVLITGLVLLCFLHLLRSTAIVLLAVPTSLIATFLVMYALGFSLNILSLLALALTIGVLVDDSIVVLENIFRHLNLGEEPKQAALNGRGEIGMAAVAITLCIVVIYVPVAFMSGIAGQIFKEYGITIATATLFSLVISFTLTPMVASMWLKKETKQPGGLWGKFVALWERSYTRLANTYASILDSALRHRPVVLVVSALALAVAVAFIPLRLLGTETMPSEDNNTFNASLRMPAGSSLQTTDQAVRQFEDMLKAYPEVDKVLSDVGGKSNSLTSIASSGGVTGAQVTVKLVDKKLRQRSVFQIADDVRTRVKSIPEAQVQISTANSLVSLLGAGLQVQVRGPDMDTLIGLSKQIEEVMRNTPGVVEVRNLEAERSPEWQVNLDRDRMKDLGISAAEAGQALRTAMGGTQISTLQRENESEIDITLIGDEEARQDAQEMERLPLKYTRGGTPIILRQIGRLTKSDAPAQINRYNRQRSLTVTASVVGRSIGDVATDIDQAIQKNVKLPTGYQTAQLGQTEQQRKIFSSLMSALLLSVVLIYMLMVALYESFMQPLAIMFSLPVAMVGAFGGLFLTGNTLNIFSILGIIMLVGLVMKNAILLVDFADILRKQGVPRRQALVEAGRLRLRPILMTTFAMVFAMSPFLLKLESGAETRAPLAAVIIGGTITSTLLTLVLVPTMYTYLDSLESWVRRKILHQGPRFVEQPAGQEPASEQQPLGEAPPQYGYGISGQ
jgi:hydrophobic/amphiphilic exporter-1 (mainly G- bacteria), HAE1 family